MEVLDQKDIGDSDAIAESNEGIGQDILNPFPQGLRRINTAQIQQGAVFEDVDTERMHNQPQEPLIGWNSGISLTHTVAPSAAEVNDTFWSETRASEWKQPERTAARYSKVNVPSSATPIGVPGANAQAYLDVESNKVYRILHGMHQEEGETHDMLDSEHMVEIANRDTVGLLPAVHIYDKETGSMEMEYVEGIPLTKLPRGCAIPTEVGVRLLEDLEKFHELGLYHGDLTDGNHWIIAPNGRIRLIDPLYIRDSEDPANLKMLQELDMATAKRKLKAYGYTVS